MAVYHLRAAPDGADALKYCLPSRRIVRVVHGHSVRQGPDALPVQRVVLNGGDVAVGVDDTNKTILGVVCVFGQSVVRINHHGSVPCGMVAVGNAYLSPCRGVATGGYGNY